MFPFQQLSVCCSFNFNSDEYGCECQQILLEVKKKIKKTTNKVLKRLNTTSLFVKWLQFALAAEQMVDISGQQ